MSHKYCANCGKEYLKKDKPLNCSFCNHITYFNPIPVTVIVLKTNKGVLLGRRNIEPGKGLWALTSGYMDLGEDHLDSAKREIFEELGIQYNGEFSILAIRGNSTKHQLLTFLVNSEEINVDSFNFIPNEEVSEIKYVSQPETLAFQGHTEVLLNYFNKSKN